MRKKPKQERPAEPSPQPVYFVDPATGDVIAVDYRTADFRKRPLGEHAPARCAPIKLKQDYLKGGIVRVDAVAAGRRVGTGLLRSPKDGAPPYIANIAVEEDYTRCKIGTQIYQRLAKAACTRGQPLASDVIRTGYSQAFWEKQVKKGRAVCLAPAEPETGTAVAWPATGRGGCLRYQLKACPVTSLGRTNKRK